MTEEKLYRVAKTHSDYINKYHKYEMCSWEDFDYEVLTRNVMYYRKKGKYRKGSWNDVIIAADTETSKHHDRVMYDEFGNQEPLPNHVVAWTISIRVYHCNIVTLYGTRPSEMVDAFKRLRKALKGDDIYCFWHNLAYDWVFMRLFMFEAFGTPEKQLNTKPHNPIMVGFSNGIIFKDSLILFGCKLEKAAKDYNVAHKKAVGSWDYDKIRDQGQVMSRSELHYIENDTLALVEVLDSLCISLNKTIYSIPYTATGIVREEVRERAKQNRGHEKFLQQAPTFEQFLKLMQLYHGGYTHSNRFFNGDFLDDDIMRCFDFASSYPFCLLSEKYPCTKFTALDMDVGPDYIIRNSDKYAFIFRVSFMNIQLKDKFEPMPALQTSKCEHTINLCTDNGRVTAAGYATLLICEQDLLVIASQYTWTDCKCTEVEVARKDYLPRWFTDYVYELFSKKCTMKPKKKSDPVGYALSKSRVNSVYGLTVQKSIRSEFIEVTEAGLYKINNDDDYAWFDSGEYREDLDKDLSKEYEKYLKNPNSVLSYTIGTYCTAYAFKNLFDLGACVKRTYIDGKLASPPRWIYSDTDSCYSDDWDYGAIMRYNQRCKEKLQANGYGPVIVDGEEYWLGVAEHNPKEDAYVEFTALGSKRYAGRSLEDGKIHITVAGVPKEKGAECLEDDLHNFQKDFIFNGKITGKLTHFYIFSKQGIYKDEWGNEIGDSIDLQPCDYHLDAVDKMEYLETDDYCMEYFGEENYNIYDL